MTEFQQLKVQKQEIRERLFRECPDPEHPDRITNKELGRFIKNAHQDGGYIAIPARFWILISCYGGEVYAQH